MSDFPEKDNLNEETKPEAASEKSETESHGKGQETQSTLFVKHVYDTKKPAKNTPVARMTDIMGIKIRKNSFFFSSGVRIRFSFFG